MLVHKIQIYLIAFVAMKIENVQQIIECRRLLTYSTLYRSLSANYIYLYVFIHKCTPHHGTILAFTQ